MGNTIDKVKSEAHDTLQSVQKLRDELRVQVHLGGMDAKRRWEKLEEEFNRVQAAAKEASASSLKALREGLHEFQKSLAASRSASSDNRTAR